MGRKGPIRRSRVRRLALLSVALFFFGSFAAQAQQAMIDYLRDMILPASSQPTPSRIEDPIPIDVTVPIANQGSSSKSSTNLVKGQTYRLVAKGIYSWFGGFRADAECSQYLDPTWQKDRFRVAAAPFMFTNSGGDPRAFTRWDPNGDPFDVYLNGKPADWLPVYDDGSGCNTKDHTYQIHYTADSDGPLRVNAYEPLLDNKGACVPSGTSCVPKSSSFTVTLFTAPQSAVRAGDVLIETVTVDPRNLRTPPEVLTLNDFSAGQQYRFVAKGMYDMYLYPGFEADAECTIAAGAGNQTWEPHRFDDPNGTSYMGYDNGDLVVNNTEIEWKATNLPLGTKGCNVEDHTYYYDYTPARTGRLAFKLLADHHFLNNGLITVDIYKAQQLSVPGGLDPQEDIDDLPLPVDPAGVVGSGRAPSGAVPACDLAGSPIVPSAAGCSFSVNPQSRQGVAVPMVGGAPYRIEVSGSYHWLNGSPDTGADAECTQGVHSADANWLPNRWGAAGMPFSYTNSGNLSALSNWDAAGDPFDLYVNDEAVTWKPLTDTGAGCNGKDHTYDSSFTPSASGPVTFKIHNPMNGVPSAHSITVKLFSGAELEAGPNDALLSTLVLTPKSDTSASTQINLTKGWAHRIVISGTYTNVFYPGIIADGECSGTDQTASSWQRNRFGTNPDTLDVYLNGGQVDWTPLDDTGGGCSSKDHSYRYLFTPSRTGPATFKLRMPYHSANEGAIVVKIFLIDGAKI